MILTSLPALRFHDSWACTKPRFPGRTEMVLGPRMTPFFSLIWDTCVAVPSSCLVITVTLPHGGWLSLGENNPLAPLLQRTFYCHLWNPEERTGQHVAQWPHTEEEGQGQKGKVLPPGISESQGCCSWLFLMRGAPSPTPPLFWVYLLGHATVVHRVCHPEARELPIAGFMHVLIHPTKGMCSPPWSLQRKTLRGQAQWVFVASRSRAQQWVWVLGLANTGDAFAAISQSGKSNSLHHHFPKLGRNCAE